MACNNNSSEFLAFRRAIYDRYVNKIGEDPDISKFRLDKRLFLVYACYCRFPCETLSKKASDMIDDINAVVAMTFKGLCHNLLSESDKITMYCAMNKFDKAMELACKSKDRRSYQYIFNVATEVGNTEMMKKLANDYDIDLYEAMMAIRMISENKMQNRVFQTLIDLGLQFQSDLVDIIPLICISENAHLLKIALDNFTQFTDEELCVMFASTITVSFVFTNEILERIQNKKILIERIKRMPWKMLIYNKQVYIKLLRLGADKEKLQLMKKQFTRK